VEACIACWAASGGARRLMAAAASCGRPVQPHRPRAAQTSVLLHARHAARRSATCCLTALCECLSARIWRRGEGARCWLPSHCTATQKSLTLRCALPQAAHDDSAPVAGAADAAAAHAPPLSAAERGAVLAGLPDDEREATAAVLGKLGGADVKVLKAAPDMCKMHVASRMHATQGAARLRRCKRERLRLTAGADVMQYLWCPNPALPCAGAAGGTGACGTRGGAAPAIGSRRGCHLHAWCPDPSLPTRRSCWRRWKRRRARPGCACAAWTAAPSVRRSPRGAARSPPTSRARATPRPRSRWPCRCWPRRRAVPVGLAFLAGPCAVVVRAWRRRA